MSVNTDISPDRTSAESLGQPWITIAEMLSDQIHKVSASWVEFDVSDKTVGISYSFPVRSYGALCRPT